MKPISDVRLADCMDFMREFPDGFFDLAVVDPPYGLQGGGKNRFAGGGLHTKAKVKFGSRFQMGGDYNGKKWDEAVPDESFFIKLRRVSKHQIIWGANYFHNMPPNRGPIVWDKMQTVPNFSAFEYAFCSVDKPAAIYRERNHGIFRDSETIHPTQKPYLLYAWLLENYAKPGDKILDTHLGSGSSRIAAHKMGFDFWGCEIDADYFEKAEKRFREAVAMPLFDQIADPNQIKMFE